MSKRAARQSRSSIRSTPWSRRCSGAASNRRSCRRSRKDKRGNRPRESVTSSGEKAPRNLARCSGSLGGGQLLLAGATAALAGLGWLHAQRVIKAVEVVEQADGAEQFHDLALGVILAQFGELRVGHRVRIARYCFGQPQSGFFGRRKIAALPPVGQVRKLLVGPSQAARKDRMACQAVGSLVHLAGADDDQFLELRRNCPGIQHGGKVSHHGRENLRPMSHYAEHIRDVAALREGPVVKRLQIGADFAAVKPRDSRHCELLIFRLPHRSPAGLVALISALSRRKSKKNGGL